MIQRVTVIGLSAIVIGTACQEAQEEPDDRGERNARSHPSGLESEKRAAVTAFWSAYRSGLAHARAGHTQAAADSLKAALAIDPLHEGALYDFGNACFDLGAYRQAEAAWKKLVRAHPHSVRGFAQLGALHACGQDSTPFDLQTAETYFKKMFALNKESSEATVRLGEVFLLQSRAAEALERFEQAISFDPGNHEAWILKGLVHWVQGDRPGGRSAYARGRPAGYDGDRPFASEEGDTRAGSNPMLVEDARHRSFFKAMIERAQSEVSADAVYGEAAARLEKVWNSG